MEDLNKEKEKKKEKTEKLLHQHRNETDELKTEIEILKSQLRKSNCQTKR